MCGRFRLTRPEKLAGRFGIEPEDDWVPRYKIAPTQNVQVIRQRAEEPKRFGSQMRWGLIPSRAKDASVGYKMINARAEMVATKPAFRDPLLCVGCVDPTSPPSPPHPTISGATPQLAICVDLFVPA